MDLGTSGVRRMNITTRVIKVSGITKLIMTRD